ncbi:hypothetical protein DPMN_193816 [Dreissena polymorpha]|uniref:Uncharacterized protein n=1 Tax=Dreissena polymorpha TaxID=45954 RepID=A0A9D4BF05_DREPO|nr:hypothetical protein DPMN_193816 [Dreissena polymorpha]
MGRQQLLCTEINRLYVREWGDNSYCARRLLLLCTEIDRLYVREWGDNSYCARRLIYDSRLDSIRFRTVGIKDVRVVDVYTKYA